MGRFDSDTKTWAGLTASAHKPLLVLKTWIVAVCAAALFVPPQLASADADGYDTPLAQAVRTATQRYRLVLWARLDGYVQSTDYLNAVGTTYTNHDRFDPANLRQPTVLVYDMAGRLVACGYQFRTSTAVFSALSGVQPDGWYQIPSHLHYNIVVDGTQYFEQHLWDGTVAPTAAQLIERKLMPANGVLKYAFLHPATKAVFIWAWRPNPNGLFDSENPTLP